MPASSQGQPHAAGGDRNANPSSDLFAPPAHPPAERAAPAAKRASEPQASTRGIDVAHAAAGLERLLAALQAKASSCFTYDLIKSVIIAFACMAAAESDCASDARDEVAVRLLLQVGDLKLSVAAEFDKVSREAHAAAQARAR